MPKFLNLSNLPIFYPATTGTSFQTFLRGLLVKPISSSPSPSSPPPPPPSSSSSSPVPTHDHIAHLILDQKSATQALETFRWAFKLPNFTHSQSTYRALIHKLCTFRHFDTVHTLLNEMPSSIGSPPNDDIFITLVRGLGRARMTQKVVQVIDLISKFEKIPSLKVFNSILDVLVKEDIDLAREFYRTKMIGKGFRGDDYTFGILMKGLCLTNRIGDGFKLLEVMKSGGIVPNTVIYNTLIHWLCKNGKVGRAKRLMKEMERPNDVTFNILISSYCGEEKLTEALVLLEKSFTLGVLPDVVTVTKIVQILCDKGRTKEALEILERFDSKGGSVDVVAYNALIKGYCKLGKPKVGRRFVEEMERKGCLPNVNTFNILISGFCEIGMLDFAIELFDDMKSDGISRNFVTYDTLIRGLCSGGRIEDGYKILDLLEETKEGSKGRISPYNSILYGLYKKNCVDEALEFLTKMVKLFPRAVGRSLSILDYCKEGGVKDAKRVYDQMIEEGGNPSALVYDGLIHGFCREGSLREAFEMMNIMIDRGYFPVASTFNALISGFCELGQVESALDLMEDLVERGCVLNAGSYNPLIDVLFRKGDFEKALMLFHLMVEEGIVPDRQTWNTLLLSLSPKTDWFAIDDDFKLLRFLKE